MDSSTLIDLPPSLTAWASPTRRPFIQSTLTRKHVRAPLIEAQTVYPDAASLPPSLAVTRLRHHAPLGSPRFVRRPDEHAESDAIVRIFEFWNRLDWIMYNSSVIPRNSTKQLPLGNRHLYQSGYVREVQLRRMLQLVRSFRPLSQRAIYCETGMNGGHSVAAMLLAHPNLKAYVFDLVGYKYSERVAALLSESFGERFELRRGSSRHSLPVFVPSIVANGSRCDLIFVDGDHKDVGALQDIKTLRWAARWAADDDGGGNRSSSAAARGAPFSEPPSVLLVDDIHLGPSLAVLHEQVRGHLTVLERYGPFPRATRHNPCMRMPAGGFAQTNGIPHAFKDRENLCHNWGFLVAHYTAARGARNRTKVASKPR